MIEALISLLLSMIVFAYGYGRLSEKVKSMETTSNKHSVDLEEIHEIKTAIAEIKVDIEYIKNKIDE